MAIDRDLLRWNGWGRKQDGFELSEARKTALLSGLAERLGGALTPLPPAAALEQVRMPRSRLAPSALAALERALGRERVSQSDRERAQHAAGKSFADTLRLRDGRLEHAPDAVAYPHDAESVQKLLEVARSEALAIVPFGGGTSVVGGVEPLLPAGKKAVVTLDTTRLDRLLAIDEESLTATFQAGIDGPSLEAELSARGFTLGHFPQSFEHSTLGGWIAARSSGQQSDGYGGIDALLVSVRLVTPRGEIVTLTVPRHAAGPDLKELILGSEGTLGVIVEATLRIAKKPTVQDIQGMLFRDFSAGVRTIRAWMAQGLPMTMMRLSDARETELSLLLRHDPEKRFDAGELLFAGAEKLGYAGNRALMLFGIEGDDRTRVSAQMLRAQAAGLSEGGIPLGKKPGESWKKERFRNPYLRDFLLDQGVAIDTMETAFEWSKLLAGHASVLQKMNAAAREHAGGGIAMGHVSHSYHDGACVYFIVIYRVDAQRALQQWRAIKDATTRAIVEAGGTLSHHHGVGTDHAAFLPAEKGALGMDVLRALKRELDPENLMNPGKLL
jgi:alkyldihydroxyacetonephosphate synthase